MKKKIYNDEIDIYDLIFNLWDNKIKIIIITAVFVILGYLYYYNLNKNFIATTTIKPISTFENQKYELYNGVSENIISKNLNSKDSLKVNIFNIDAEKLFNLFISKIRTVEIIEEGIIRSKLIDKDNFINEENYDKAVKRNAILIIDQMTGPNNNKKDKDKVKNKSFWQYNFQVSEKLKWMNFLEYIERQANDDIRQYLINQFNINLEIIGKSTKFLLEDIDLNIANEIEDYKTSISNRLAFLKEQAQIARTLDIKKNTLRADSIQLENTLVTNIKAESSYYLKGYESIEKEIELINSREQIELFIPDLIELEGRKRYMMQDKKIERLKVLFSKTPIYNKNDFIAAKIDYYATDYKSEESLQKTLSISLIIGVLISIMYLLLNKVMNSRK